MKFISRSDLGWPDSEAPEQKEARGVKIHYLGTPFHAEGHSDCVEHVKQIRLNHLANKVENYSDIAYNYLACGHGYVFEGRGKRKRTGANGNQDLNKAHYSVCALLGFSGDVNPTDEMIDAIKDAVFLLRSAGAGSEVKGHRDGYATACPGEPLYALVRSGSLSPDVIPPAPKPKPVYAPFPGVSFFRSGRKHPLITAMGKRLVSEGYKGYKVGPGPAFTQSDIKAVAWFQRKQGWSGSDANGYPGPETWKRLRVPKV